MLKIIINYALAIAILALAEYMLAVAFLKWLEFLRELRKGW